MSEILLQTKALTKQYGHQKAVDNVDIHIKKGAIYGFIGRNGAGKTTCMRMIGGLAKPTSGEISMFGYAGKDLSNLAELSPRYAVSNEIATIKTVTARLLRRDYEDYLKQFLWGDSFWSRSYFVATSGGVTLDVLKEYVETQNRKPGRPYGTKKKK